MVRRAIIWLFFWLFVVASWAVLGFYFFIAGWSSCQATGTCTLDRIVIVVALLLMPAQVLLAVYLKQRLAAHSNSTMI
jgi:hypothetical protein